MTIRKGASHLVDLIRTFVIPVVAAIVLVGVALWIADRWNFNDNFFKGALLATLVGVSAGIPIALAIDRSRNEVTRLQAIRRDATRRRTVLGLLHDELDENLRRLRDPSGLGRRPRPTITYVPLLTSAWETFQASGETRLIEDPDLLGQLAETHDAIRTINRLDNLALEYAYGAAAAFKGPASTPQIEELRNRTTDLQDRLMPTIEQAVAMASAAFDEAEAALSG